MQESVKRISAAVVAAIAGPYLYIMLTSSDFFRSLITHGGLVLCFVPYRSDNVLQEKWTVFWAGKLKTE